MTDNKPEIKHCPNCETAFDNSFKYCPNCGQANKKLSLSFKYFISEFLTGMFNLDSKIFRTLKLLFFKPGKLSKEFIEGRRNTYIPPVRLYLAGSLIYFTVSSFFSDPIKFTDDSNITADSASNTITMNNLDSLQHFLNEDDTLSELVGSGDSIIEAHVNKSRLKKISTPEGQKKFKEKIMDYIPIGMFFLVPLTALLFFLLFKKDTYYIEHLIFVIHLQTLFYLIFTVLNLLEIFINTEIMEAITAIIFITVLVSWVKKYYMLNWLKTIGKTILLLMMYAIVYLLFFLSIAAISFVIL
jgi:hypothetical protein